MKIFVSALASVLFASALFAQSDRGTITGTVIDQGGAVVPAATFAFTSTA
jgi:hypothetical protein